MFADEAQSSYSLAGSSASEHTAQHFIVSWFSRRSKLPFARMVPTWWIG